VLMAPTIPDILAPLATIEAHLARRPALLGRGTTDGLPDTLVDAAAYALLGPGKRLRPLLAWHACVAAGGRGESSLPAGTALEMVHAFSLVHDDLPALDDDDLRRGRPTLHRHAGEAMAILVGDALLAGAFESLADDADLEPSARLALVRELAGATGAMIGGQVWDTLGGLPPTPDAEAALRLIHRNKTGALIRAACRMGAMCAPPGARADAALPALTAFAERVGLCFQIVDDLLDVTQTAEHAGKRTGKDAQAGKTTYPGVLGIDASRVEAARLHREAIAALKPLGPSAAGLTLLADHLCDRTR